MNKFQHVFWPWLMVNWSFYHLIADLGQGWIFPHVCSKQNSGYYFAKFTFHIWINSMNECANKLQNYLFTNGSHTNVTSRTMLSVTPLTCQQLSTRLILLGCHKLALRGSFSNWEQWAFRCPFVERSSPVRELGGWRRPGSARQCRREWPECPLACMSH